MTTKRVKTSLGKKERPSWGSQLFESNSSVSMANKFNVFEQVNVEQSSRTESMEIDTEMAAPNAEAPDFPPCQQVVCPEIEMTDYIPTQETQKNRQEDVEMVDASFFPPEIVDVFTAPNLGPRQQVPPQQVPTTGDPFKRQDANTTAKPDNAPPTKTPADPPSSFELSILELIKSKKIYSVSYEKGKLEVNLE
ncbi:hypothetical protein F4811DRAFT_511417 [Daldinia bambusicola]|nr:hypothetical protein F4811DRAFT_511417 [Daldinia bambusicola]